MNEEKGVILSIVELRCVDAFARMLRVPRHDTTHKLYKYVNAII